MGSSNREHRVSALGRVWTRSHRCLQRSLLSAAPSRSLSGVETKHQEQRDAVVEQSGWDDDDDDDDDATPSARPFKRTRSFIPAKLMDRIEEVPEGTTDVPVVRKKKRRFIRLSVFVALLSRKRR